VLCNWCYGSECATFSRRRLISNPLLWPWFFEFERLCLFAEDADQNSLITKPFCSFCPPHTAAHSPPPRIARDTDLTRRPAPRTSLLEFQKMVCLRVCLRKNAIEPRLAPDMYMHPHGHAPILTSDDVLHRRRSLVGLVVCTPKPQIDRQK
jgi:hypothetical protein